MKERRHKLSPVGPAYTAGAPVPAVSGCDELIEQIYQGPLEARPWQTFLRSLRLRLDADCSAMTWREARMGISPLILYDHYKLDAEELHSRSFNLEEHRINPMLSAFAATPSGVILTIDDVVPRGELVKTEFYKTVMVPNDTEHYIGMCVCEPSGWRSQVGLINSGRKPAFTQPVKDFLAALHPHLQRAFSIYARLKRNELERDIFEEAIDRLMIGTFILDGQAKLIHANSAGQRMLRQASVIRDAGGRLALASHTANARLQKLIERALGVLAHRTSTRYIEATHVESSEGGRFGVLVRSARASDRYWSAASPSVVIHVGELGRKSSAAERFVAHMFDLTPTEAMLATLLSQGLTLKEAAAALNVTQSTVRSYAKIVFEKMGVSRQAELVRVILTSVAILA